MKFFKYLKDQLYLFLFFGGIYGLLLLIFFAFKIDPSVILSTSFLFFCFFLIVLLTPYFRMRKFYTNLLQNIERLEESYLVLETLPKPEFYEGELLVSALYQINKSMNENVRLMEEHLQDFKEYIEMWIHEVKIPISTLRLMSDHHGFDKRVKLQLKRLEDYVDQVLYYARCENAEKDYLIKEVNLSKVIKNVGLKNMDDLLENKIEFIVENVQYKVLTDSKWLEFILGQIVNNSIKYRRNIHHSYIKIYAFEDENKITLVIEDNGIGIKESDLKQVFDQSFTGENGRGTNQSTGMGLYITKNMCKRLGHQIEIDSQYQKYTKVFILFSKNKFYDVLK